MNQLEIMFPYQLHRLDKEKEITNKLFQGQSRLNIGYSGDWDVAMNGDTGNNNLLTFCKHKQMDTMAQLTEGLSQEFHRDRGTPILVKRLGSEEKNIQNN